MRLKSLTYLIIAFSFPVIAWSSGLKSPVSSLIHEGYNYWSDRYVQENSSPVVCSLDSVYSLKKMLIKEYFYADELTMELQQNCEQWMFVGAMLPSLARDMDDDSRAFFKDFYGMAFYLSGLNPTVSGSYHKMGWWQLTYPVAIKYGLRVDAKVDERMDPAKSSLAAASYYGDLKQKYGSEELALIAFVYGPIAVERLLQTETTEVPLSFQNTINEIKTYHAMFGWMLERMPFTHTKEKREVLDTLSFQTSVVVDLLLSHSGLNKKEFLKYNPVFVSDVIPGNYDKVVIPRNKLTALNVDSLQVASALLLDSVSNHREAVRDRLKRGLPDPYTHEAYVHKVRSGESLGLISNKYAVSVSNIKSWNSLRSDRIYAGQKLTLYVNKRKQAAVQQVDKKPTAKPSPTLSGSDEYVVYVVRSGESLWGIAKLYPGVSAQNIMDWNGIGESIYAGQKLKIKKSEIRS